MVVGVWSLRAAGAWCGCAASGASRIVCRSPLVIQAQPGGASLANTLGIAKRCALRCAPMAGRSLRHLIGDATLAGRQRDRPLHQRKTALHPLVSWVRSESSVLNRPFSTPEF